MCLRLRSCEAAYELLQKYSSQYTQEVTWIDESYSQLKNLAPLEGLAREQIEPTTVSFDSLEGTSQVDKSINRVQSDAFAEADFFKCDNLLQALYKKVNEHMPQLEKVNVVGSRYIREAKVRPRELTLSARRLSECVFEILSHLDFLYYIYCKYLLFLSLGLINQLP